MADNFWRPGNLLGGIDVETGRIVEVRRRAGFGSEVVTEHPDTGASFEDRRFPEWEAMRDLALRAATAISTCPLQGWDVALCADGPVLLELEGNGGHPVMSQICFETGLFQGRLKTHIERRFAEYRARKKKGGRVGAAMTELKQGIASLPDARGSRKATKPPGSDGADTDRDGSAAPSTSPSP